MTSSKGPRRAAGRNPPIFILSSERSGSTLCRYILDSLRDIGSPGEVVLGELSASLARVLAHIRSESDLAAPATDGQIRDDIRRIVDGVMDNYLVRAGKKIWCDKSPANVRFLALIGRVFPDARYVCLFRDFRDTAHSCIAAGQLGYSRGLQEYIARHPGNFVMAMAESWADKVERLIAFESEHGSNCIRPRYEDVVSDADREISRVFEFLGLPGEPDLLMKALSTPHLGGGGDRKIQLERTIHRRSVGSGRDLPLGTISRTLTDRLNRLLVLLGYASLDGAGAPQ